MGWLELHREVKKAFVICQQPQSQAAEAEAEEARRDTGSANSWKWKVRRELKNGRPNETKKRWSQPKRKLKSRLDKFQRPREENWGNLDN